MTGDCLLSIVLNPFEDAEDVFSHWCSIDHISETKSLALMVESLAINNLRDTFTFYPKTEKHSQNNDT